MTQLARITATLILAAALVTAPRAATGAEPKPAPVRTVGPVETLAARQQADLAAKRAASEPITAPAPPFEPPARLVASRRAPVPLPAVRIRRLPQVSDALGPIPREEWIRRALGKGPDMSVILPTSAAPESGGPR